MGHCPFRHYGGSRVDCQNCVWTGICGVLSLGWITVKKQWLFRHYCVSRVDYQNCVWTGICGVLSLGWITVKKQWPFRRYCVSRVDCQNCVSFWKIRGKRLAVNPSFISCKIYFMSVHSKVMLDISCKILPAKSCFLPAFLSFAFGTERISRGRKARERKRKSWRYNPVNEQCYGCVLCFRLEVLYV